MPLFVLLQPACTRQILHQRAGGERSMYTHMCVRVCRPHVLQNTDSAPKPENVCHGYSLVQGGSQGKKPKAEPEPELIGTGKAMVTGWTWMSGYSVTEISPTGPGAHGHPWAHIPWRGPACEGHGAHLAKLFTSLCTSSPPSDKEWWPLCWCTTKAGDPWLQRVRVRKGEGWYSSLVKSCGTEDGEDCPEVSLVPWSAYWPQPRSCHSAWAGFGAGPGHWDHLPLPGRGTKQQATTLVSSSRALRTRAWGVSLCSKILPISQRVPDTLQGVSLDWTPSPHPPGHGRGKLPLAEDAVCSKGGTYALWSLCELLPDSYRADLVVQHCCVGTQRVMSQDHSWWVWYP